MAAVVPVDQHPTENDGVNDSSEQQQQQVVGGRCLFLELPRELRDMIYRHLLVADEPIRDLDSHHPVSPTDLHPQILATCSQLLDEAQSILYGDNVLRMRVRDFIDQFRMVLDDRCEHLWNPMPNRIRRRLLLTKSFEITYRLYSPQATFPNDVYTESRAACRLMSQLDRIRFVGVKIRPKLYTYMSGWQILRAWSMLRNVSAVAVDGQVDPFNKGLVQDFMKKATTQSPLPRMYYALERYASRLYCCDCLLRIAYTAAEWDDLKSFQEIRKKIIERVNSRINELQDRLTENDPNPEVHIPVIECENKDEFKCLH